MGRGAAVAAMQSVGDWLAISQGTDAPYERIILIVGLEQRPQVDPAVTEETQMQLP